MSFKSSTNYLSLVFVQVETWCGSCILQLVKINAIEARLLKERGRSRINSMVLEEPSSPNAHVGCPLGGEICRSHQHPVKMELCWNITLSTQSPLVSTQKASISHKTFPDCLGLKMTLCSCRLWGSCLGMPSLQSAVLNNPEFLHTEAFLTVVTVASTVSCSPHPSHIYGFTKYFSFNLFINTSFKELLLSLDSARHQKPLVFPMKQ